MKGGAKYVCLYCDYLDRGKRSEVKCEKDMDGTIGLAAVVVRTVPRWIVLLSSHTTYCVIFGFRYAGCICAPLPVVEHEQND